MSGLVYERKAGAYRDQPVVLFKAQVTRKAYWRALRLSLLIVLAGAGVFYILTVPEITTGETPFIPPPYGEIALGVGRIAAGLLLAGGGGRLAYALIMLIRRRPERVVFYDRGFAWERRGNRVKYGWNAVKAVREDPHAWFWRGKPVLQWGHITFKMRDGSVYRFTPAHGNMLAFLRRVREQYAAETGTRMGQMLRLNKSFRVHPKLGVTPAGLLIDDKKRIEWKNLQIQNDGSKLIVSRISDNGNIQQVRTYPVKQIDNFAGFMELVESNIDTFQRPNPYG